MKQLSATLFLGLLVPGCVPHRNEVRGADVVVSPASLPLDPHPAPSSSPPGEEVPRAPHYGIDWNFIQSVEGRSRTHGYVPAAPDTGRPLGRSGVTVGTGFDLGQHDAGDLERLGIDDDLTELLAPYLRKQGASAQELLHERPLVLTPAQAATLDRAKRLDTARKIERRFDETRAGYVPAYAQLSPGQQTVIFSLAMQYGTRLDRKTPAFWRQVTRGRFDVARRELRSFGDGYPSRRNREADVLLGELVAVESSAR